MLAAAGERGERPEHSKRIMENVVRRHEINDDSDDRQKRAKARETRRREREGAESGSKKKNKAKDNMLLLRDGYNNDFYGCDRPIERLCAFFAAAATRRPPRSAAASEEDFFFLFCFDREF